MSRVAEPLGGRVVENHSLIGTLLVAWLSDRAEEITSALELESVSRAVSDTEEDPAHVRE